ncbi:MAG: mannonate dehydratase [Pseudomonadota bacterium]
MHETWRWFGPVDPISIDDVTQAGAQGIVTALHEVAPGVVWQPDAIAARQDVIGKRRDGTPSGLKWDVVESLPVSEDIKQQQGAYRAHFDAYRESLRHIAAAGIEVVCYNFMPILDWTRTDLAFPRPNGATCMRFDLTDFAAFDIHILARPGAAEAFPEAVVDAACERFAKMSDEACKALTNNIICGLPGTAEGFTLDDIRAHLAGYDAIDEEALQRHLVDFLSEVAPTAQELGLRLCCHPDDPPFPLLGLPRILSTQAQYQTVLDAVDLSANGVTLCSGSLGARPDNDLPEMMRALGERVHFLHLRNVTRDTDSVPASFFEDDHLAGGTDMVALIEAVLAEESRRRTVGRADATIPFRPDHGQDILDDLGRKQQPGYPAIGRLKGLAELRGVAAALAPRFAA